MKLATIIITLLLIGGFATGFSAFYGAILSSSVSPITSATLNTTNQTYESMEGMFGEVKASQNRTVDTGSSILEGPTNLIFGAYNAVMLVLKTPSFFQGIFSDMMRAGKAPTWVETMVYGIISIIIIFAIIEFLTGRPTE